MDAPRSTARGAQKLKTRMGLPLAGVGDYSARDPMSLSGASILAVLRMEAVQGRLGRVRTRASRVGTALWQS